MKNKLVLLLTTLCCSIILYANGVKIGGIYYILDSKNMTASVTYSTKDIPLSTTNSAYKGDIIIPTKITYKKKEYRVTSIGKYAFRSAKLTSIIIPNSVIDIEDGAFMECGEGLSDISLPPYLRSIGKCVFSGTKLKEIAIPSSVCSIAKSFGNKDVINATFHGSHFESINVDSKNEYYCSIEGVLFDKKMSDLIKYPCEKTDSNYMIPDGVENISNEAFYQCKNLKTIVVPNSVKLIGHQAFYGCSKLENLTIGQNVTSLGEKAFAYCKNITSVIIPGRVNFMWKSVFMGCYNIEEIVISKGVTYIGEEAFYSSSKLSKITIPNSISFMGKDAFGPYPLNIKELNFEEGFKYLDWMTKKYAIKDDRCHQVELLDILSFSEPPLLAVVNNSLSFADASNNNRIEVGEQCSIQFQIENNGKGSANNCEARVKLSGSTSGIKVQTVQLPTIAVGKTYEVSIPVMADVNTQNGKVTFSIEVYEPNGWGVAPFDLTVATKAYEAPFLQVVDYNITSISGKIKKMEPFTLTFNLQNTKYGDAEQVKVKVNLPANIFVMDGSAEQSFPLIKSGETKTIKLSLAANNNYSSTNIPVTIDVTERYGRFAENKQLNIVLNQTTSSNVNITAKEEPQQERKEIQLAMMTSDVDRNIPKTDVINENTFVVIIANENYQQVASVPFALNDGKIFRQYCEQTLGIPANHIREQSNATGNQIKAQINWLRTVVEAFGNPNIIFYYAGHGIPDEASKTAYLLPVDGILADLSTCYKLDDLYNTLGDMPAGQISVFMDACFSGSKREAGMLASARGVALKTKSGVPQGNMVVFSAAQGDETAYPYTSQQHGMFTYYLLKKLQDTKGEVSLRDLGSYITSEVKKQSVLENNKPQTPTVTPSAFVADTWQSWKLK